MDRSGPVRVVVWMRDAPPLDGPRSRVLDRLRELEADGAVDDVSVRVWGRYVDPPSDAPASEEGPIQARIAEFEAWADREGHSLEPAFGRCERSTMVSAERREVIRLPLQCLAVYAGDRLVGVFPCSTGSGTETVADCIRRLGTEAIVDDE
ncbi:L,D-transpeptidase [Haloplanus pelagicus]|uniref:L,D-transpeptidase n=1 Tax=Haloplanus pelagicus TaxID=2949995 RepID=UPI00203B6CED|nr:L,D-transpeptidase [Haloplanus sp. HW8-1]